MGDEPGLTPFDKDVISRDITVPRITQDHLDHIDRLTNNFKLRATEKYKAGVIEHGGNIWDMPLIDLINNLEEELIDAWVYLQTIKDKLK